MKILFQLPPLLLLLSVFAMLGSAQAAAALKVAALHPILADLARQVGGPEIEVVEVLKPGADAHHFEPSTRDLASMRGVQLVLACGKHLEPYLDKLRDSLGSSTKLVEVGRPIPSLLLDPKNELFLCCPAHSAGGIDPHWWHSAENMRRAALVLAEEFAAADPSRKAAYNDAAKAAGVRFLELKSWAQREFSAIPRADRKLVTAHAAFGYFCKEYGFKMLPLMGTTRSDDSSAAHLAKSIALIREQKIRAVFPEDQANPKVLAEIVRSTGAKIGAALIADGTAKDAHTFETMFRHNVNAITSALKP
jgi:zinc/manganese transport system substrate-binding protein